MAKRSLPMHVGFIPDGNRRWARERGLEKQQGYGFGIEPGLALFEMCQSRGIPEISIYGFTKDNTKRPSVQCQAFSEACVAFAEEVVKRGAALLVLGDDKSQLSPRSCGRS